MSTAVDLAPGRGRGLRLRHPIIVAAGGGGFGAELLEATRDHPPGALVTRSLTRTPDRGGPPPRMLPLPDGLLHALGTPNPGLEAVLRRQAPRWSASDVPVIVSICADDVEDLAYMARTLEMQPDVAGIELNLTCPDRGRGGAPIGLEVETAEVATVAVRAVTDLPLLVKLTAMAPDLRAVARAVVAAGADVISAIGPLPGLALDGPRHAPALGTDRAGLSGPAIRPVGLHAVHLIAGAVNVPVIGVGGVSSLDHVLDYLAAGASVVGLATAALADPGLAGRLGDELATWSAQHGVAVRDLVGRARPRSGARTRRGRRASRS